MNSIKGYYTCNDKFNKEIGEGMLFSDAFKLGRAQPELDFVDIDLFCDFPLYFDPGVFLESDDEFAKSCAEDIYDFFDAVMGAISRNDRSLGVALLTGLKEPNDTFLGVSRGYPSGRGVGSGQAEKIYDSLRASGVAGSALITDLSDYAMFVEGIGPDKISDMTTNIIRGKLLQYTKDQCELHGITLTPSLPSGLIWSSKTRNWKQDYIERPYFDEAPILLVPKRYVKWQGEVNKRSKSYYKHFVRNFIRDEQLRTNGSLVQLVKRHGAMVPEVLLGDIEKKFPNTKQFIKDFSENHPDEYQKFKRTVVKHNPVSDGSIFAERDKEFSPGEFCDHLARALRSIPSGNHHASDYHHLMVGILQYIFYPMWTAPRLETPINDRRKRIDITYVNSAELGFFRKILVDAHIHARWIMVECKNYSNDPKNPEIDQLAMRFSPQRGNFGILCYRQADARDNVILRCRDAARASRGYIIALNDEEILAMLDRISQNRRQSIDDYLSARFSELLE